MKTLLQSQFRSFTSMKKSVTWMMLMICLQQSALADIIVTPAASGTGISADRASNASVPAYTLLGNIVLTETLMGDFSQTGGSAQTLILTAPTGWVFNTASGSAAISSGTDISSVSLSVSASEITISVDVAAVASLDEITLSGIEVQATNGASLPSAGNMYVSTANPGTATIAGIVSTTNTDGSGGTGFGALSQMAGDATTLVFNTEPSGAVLNTIFVQQPVVVTQDQFGNPSSAGLGANKNVVVSISAGTGSLYGTTTLDIGTAAGNGIVSFTNLFIDAAGVKKLMANATGLTFSVTNDFTVAQGSSTTAITTDVNPSCFGSNITLTATVIPAAATGTVEFFDGVTSLGTASVTAGTATLLVGTLSVGNHSLSAVYAGDTDYTGSSSVPWSQDINPAVPVTPGAIAGPVNVCPGVTNLIYSIASVTDATSYNWTVPAGWTITSGAGTTSISVTAGTAGQNGNISVTATNTCGTSAASNLAVTVDPGTPGTPGTISGPSPVCPGTSGILYSIPSVANATIYNWTVPAGWTITAGAGTTNITVTSGVAPGNITVTAGNSCGTSAAQSRAITLNPAIPATPGSITGAATLCPGATGINYSIAAVPNATSYTWSVPAGWTITAGAGTTAITVNGGAAGQNGNISVTATNSCGTSSPSILAVTVSPVAPAMPGSITGPSPVCQSTTGLVYSIAAVANATSYNWAVPAGWTITSGAGTNSITVTSGLSGGNITVAAVNFCGSSDAAQTVNINPVNATNNTGWTDNDGPKTSGNISVFNGAGQRRGYLKFPLTAITPGATITSSSLRLTNNGSSSSTATNQVNALGNTDPVAAAAGTLYNAIGSGTNYNSQTWANTGSITLNLNATANTDIQGRITSPGWLGLGLVRGGSANFTFFGIGSGANTPVLTVNFAAIRSLAVSMNPPVPATPGTITGAATVCSNTTGNVYSIAAVANATTYTWTVPAGWTITSGQGTTSITVTAGNAGDNGNITVTAGNSCGTSGIRTRAVTVDQTPTTSIAGPAQAVCMPATAVTLAANTPLVGTGAWSVVSGPNTSNAQFSSISNPTATFTRAGGAGTYQLRWTITNGVCTSQSTVNITYNNPPTAPNISFNEVVDDNSETIITCGPIGPNGQNDIDIFNSTPGGATFNWQYSTNAGPWTNSGIPNTSTEYPVASFGSIVGTHQFRVIMQWGGCTVTSDVVTLTVNPTSSIGSTTGTGCSGIGFSVSPTGFPGGTSYSWTAPVVTGGMTGGSAGSGSSVSGTLTNNTSSAQTATYTVTPVYGSTPSCSITFTVIVTINPRPTISATPTTQTRCSGAAIGTINISNPNSVPGTSFSWSRNNTTNLTGIPNAGTGSSISGTLVNNTGTTQTTIFSIVASASGCTSTTTVSVTVNPLPVANSGGNQVICSTVASTVLGGNQVASGGTGPYTYTWSPAAGLSATNVANPTATPSSFPANYSLVVTDANGCVSPASVMTITQGAVTKTWNGDGVSGGTGDDNFNNPQNWLPKGVPAACNDVVMNVEIESFLFGSSVIVDFNNDVTIKSLTSNVSGFQFLNFTPTIFRLNVANRAFTILNNTSLTTSCTGVPVSNTYNQVSVASGGVVRYEGNLVTTGTAATNQVMPFNATTNNTGRFYINGNANLGSIANDFGNKPAYVVFDGAATQTITHNSGTQTIYLGVTATEVGENNAPTVVLAGAGTGGFRNIGNLRVNENATLDVAQQLINRNSAGGSIHLDENATMKLGRNNGGISTSNFPSNYSSYSFHASSTVEYNAPVGQNVIATPFYGSLRLSNAGNKNPTGNINAARHITIADAAIFIGGTNTITLGGNWTNYSQAGFLEQNSIVDFNGNGPQTISTTGGEIYYQLRKTAAGYLTQLSDVAVQGGGSPSYTLSNGTHDAGTFRLNSNTATFNISAGLLKLARLNTVLPEFDIASYNLTGGTIELYGNGVQTLRGARAYRNLTFSTSGVKTLNAATPSVTGTILTNDAAIVDAGANVFGGAGTNLTMTGTSVYRTAGTGIKPDALGTYTLNAGTSVEFTNSAIGATEDIRLDLPVYYNLVVKGNNVANPTFANGVKMQAGGTFTVSNGGIFKLANSAGFTGSLVTAIEHTNNPAIVLEQGSSVEYYGGALGTNPQVITNQLDYEGLILSGSSVKTAPSDALTVKGNFTNTSSGFAHNSGTVLLNGTIAQDFNSTGTTLSFYHLNIGNPVHVNILAGLHVEKQLALVSSGKLNLASGDITLRSTATHTANVDKILTNDAISYGTGRFVTERYIATGVNPGEHAKSWQFLAVPLNTTQTVKDAWQEGSLTANGNPNPGYGTQITSNLSGALSLGFDVHTPNGGPSMKTYNYVSDAWDGIANTSSLPITNPKGYMVFVRGDRSVTAFNQPANATVLRSRGKLYIPSANVADAPPVTTVQADKFEAVGNPYASAIDFTQVSRAGGVDDKYYVWDPLLTANYNGLGGYQTISAANGWMPVPGGTANYNSSVAYNLVQSGQAFFVYATGASGTVSFTEVAKVSGHNMVFRPGGNTNAGLADRQYFRVQLHNANVAGLPLSDGNVVAMDSEFSDEHDGNDALKINNTGENIAVAKSGKKYALETRKPVAIQDTIFYHTSNLRRQAYQLRFSAEHMNGAIEATLVDRFLGNQVPVSTTGATVIDFTVTTDPGSAASDRFYVVFKALRPVPVTITRISAKRNSDANVQVQWETENEVNIQQYEVERSQDGRLFNVVGNNLPTANNGGAGVYQHTDRNPLLTASFYRIRATSSNGLVQYSNTVKVAAIKAESTISVYPNPVADRTAKIYFNNQLAGNYRLALYNNGGQLLMQKQTNISMVTELKSWPLGSQLPSGNYSLRITAPDGRETVVKLFIP